MTGDFFDRRCAVSDGQSFTLPYPDYARKIISESLCAPDRKTLRKICSLARRAAGASVEEMHALNLNNDQISKIVRDLRLRLVE